MASAVLLFTVIITRMLCYAMLCCAMQVLSSKCWLVTVIFTSMRSHLQCRMANV